MTETHTDPDQLALDGTTTDREVDHDVAATPASTPDGGMPADDAGGHEMADPTHEATRTNRSDHAGEASPGRGADGSEGEDTDDPDDADGTDGTSDIDGTDDIDGNGDIDGTGDTSGLGDGAEEATPGRQRGGRVSQLEREGEVAADFLETLLDIADLDGDIEVDIDGDRAAVSIVDSDEGRVPRRLVGTEGKVLEALQELTRLAVQTATGERSRLMLDVAGHRAERRTVLVGLAKEAIGRVKNSGERLSLNDMSAFERKVVHDEVAASGLDSESEGVEPHRHIVIIPA